MAEPFDTFAIVEVMGHKRYAGRVSEQVVAGTGFVRVDVPEVPGAPGFTKLFGTGSIYAITPTDEETAKKFAAAERERPVDVYTLQRGARVLTGELIPPDEDDEDPFADVEP